MFVKNRRAYHDYTIFESLEAGIHLTGAEVKSVKGNRMSLEGSFVRIMGTEAYLINAQIFPYSFARLEGYDPKRTRKLLLHKKEIMHLLTKVQSERLTLVVLECYTKKSLVKLKIALAKGKKEYEKREKKRRKDMDRDTARTLRGKL